MEKFLHSRWTLTLAVLALGLIAVLIAGLTLRPHTFSGTVLDTPKQAYDFSLTGVDGRPVRLSDLRGRLVMVFFGYTNCPDECPATLHNLHAMLEALGSQSDRVRVVFITVDPERDTPARMQSYLAGIDPRMLGLTGTLDEISQTAAQYGVFFQKGTYNSQGSYEITHTLIIQLIDSKGLMRVVYPSETPSTALAEDVSYLLKHP
ncbi:MAG TPA: SCO family protein [Anaerolineaceae bacterium]